MGAIAGTVFVGAASAATSLVIDMSSTCGSGFSRDKLGD